MQGYKYDAFISYRHTEPDKTVAEKLHRMLETYKTPKAVVNKGGQKKVGRVFRDRDELPTSPNLADNIQQALESADHLIVICSPRTPASQWVNKEIETFGALHGYDKILALLIEGEPVDSFPKPLRVIREKIVHPDGTEAEITREVEPLAADIRAESPGAMKKKLKTEILRLLAPILNCTFDDLRQRHRERFIRRMLTLSISLSLFFLGFGSFSAWQAYQIKLQSDLVRLKSDEVARQSQMIQQKSDEVSRQSELIKQQSDEVSRQNEQIREKSEEVALQSELIQQQSEEVAQQNEEIRRKSEEVARQSEQIRQQSEEVARQSRVIKQKSDEVEYQSEQLQLQVNTTLEGQSLYLSNESEELLSSGDTMRAILAARAALPVNLTAPERPYVPEAEYALSNALGAYEIKSTEHVAPRFVHMMKHYIQVIAISPDEKAVVASTLSGELYVWNADNGALINLYRVDNGLTDLEHVLFVDNETVVLDTDDHVLRLNIYTLKELWSYETYSSAMALSPDKKKIAIGYHDIVILDTATGDRIYHNGMNAEDRRYMLELTFSEDGRLLCAYSNEEKVYAYDLTTKKLIGQFDGKYENINGIAVSNLGILAIASNYQDPTKPLVFNGGLDLVVLETGRRIYSQDYASIDHLQFTALSNTMLFFSAGEEIVIFNTDTCEVFQRYPHGSDVVDFSLYNNHILSTAQDGRMRYLLYNGEENIFRNISLYKKADLLVGSTNLVALDLFDRIIVFKRPNNDHLSILQGHTSSLEGVVFSPDNQRLLSYTYSPCEVMLWDLRNQKKLGSHDSASTVMSACFTGNGRIMIIFRDGTVSLYDAYTLKQLDTKALGGTVSKCVYSPDKTFCYVECSGGNRIIRPCDLSQLDHNIGFLYRVAFSRDNQRFYYCGYSEIQMVELISGELCQKKQVKDLRDMILSPDNQTLAWLDKDSAVHLLDGNTLEEKRVIESPILKIRNIQFDPSGKTMLFVMDDAIIRHYEVESGKLIGEYDNLDFQPEAIEFSKDGKYYMTSHYSDTVFWLSTCDKPIGRVTTQAWVDPEFRYVVTKDSSGIAIMPFYDTEMLLKEAERQLKGRELTELEKRELFLVE